MSDDEVDFGESAEELFEQAPVGYLTTLGDGRIVRVNQTFLDWTGYSRETLLSGKRFDELLTVPGRLFFDTTVAPLLQIQGFVREVTFDITDSSNQALPVLTNFSLRAASGARAAVVRIAIFNATHRRQYERELLLARQKAERATRIEQEARTAAEQASRVKDEFLAMISHELRTPLAAILGWIQVLRHEQTPADALEKGLSIIERNTRVQVQLVDDLLDMSRIISGKMRLNVQQVELATVVEAAIETCQVAADAKSLRLQMILDPSITVTGDPGRLQQIFWNLLSNAVKFTPKGGTIRVTMAQINSHVETSISDTGQGMTVDFLDHAFERFRQADTLSTPASSGLGLGLSIVKQLVEMHGGNVAARSDGPGCGSTFVVHLPLGAVRVEGEDRIYPRAAVTVSPASSQTVSLKGLRIVVVEDQTDARELVERLLTSSGAEVRAVATAESAIDAVLSTQPHVLISDIGLPDQDGYDLIRRVRLLGDGVGAVPAIAMTAFSRLDDRTRAMLAGYQAHLAKPVDARELTATVAMLATRSPR